MEAAGFAPLLEGLGVRQFGAEVGMPVVAHGVLDAELGFRVFSRDKRKLALTGQGDDLLQLCGRLIESVERGIVDLRQREHTHITIGMATYFASRWLSPRVAQQSSAIMTFRDWILQEAQVG